MAKRFLSNIRINDAYTFPASDGTNNQVIKTDGSGNLSFGQLAADSASVIHKDVFTGNGSTTIFSMVNALNDENQSNIYIDGVYQSKSTYSIANKAITFSTAPLSGHEIEVISTTGINSGPTAIYTDTFTANGSTTAFTLGQTVHSENQTLVFLNGVYQFKGTYILSGTTLTLDTAPSNGVSIEVMSIGSAYSGGDILYDHDFTSAGIMKTDGSGTYSILTDSSANWNTAYGWGDHGLSAQDKTDIGNLSGTNTGDQTLTGLSYAAPLGADDNYVTDAQFVVISNTSGTNTGDQDLSTYATQSYVGTQITNLVDSSPATLNTLNELAAALGDDPNFATTTATNIGLKAPLASPSFTGIPILSNRAKIIDGSAQINIGQWDGTNHRIEADANRPLKIYSYNTSSGIALGISGSDKLTINGNGSGITVAGAGNFTGNVDVTGSIIARVNASYYSTKNYLGDTWEFASDTTDGVTFKITGGAANTTGNFFKFQTQAGGATAATALTINKDLSSTFAGNVNFNGPSTKFNTDGDSFFEILDAGTNACYLRAGSGDEIYIGANNNYQLRLKTNKDVVMDNGGNLGIGVASPVGKLQVSLPAYTNEDTNSQQAIFGVDSGYGVRIGYNETDNKGYINVLKPGVAWGNLILQEELGKVGIGTSSPDYILTTQGSGVQRLKVVATDPSQHSSGVYFLVKNGASQVGTGTIATQNNGDMDFYTGSTSESFKMTIEAGGNVGIGETSPSAKLHVNGKIKIGSGGGSGTDSGSISTQVNSFTFGATGETGLLIRNDGQTGELSTIGFGYSENNRTPVVIGGIISNGGGATAGEFVIGTRNSTSNTVYPTIRLKVTQSGNTLLYNSLIFSDSGYVSDYSIRRNANAIIFSGGSDGYFFNRDDNSVTDMWISGDGITRIGGTSNLGYVGAHNIQSSAASGYALIVRNSDTSTTNGSVMQFNRAETTATTGGYCTIYRQGSTTTGTNRWIVYANGNITNTNNSYGSLSDERKKENIVDATPKLDKLMEVKVRNFNLIGEETKQIGVVAQELEEVFPGMISESKDPDSEDETLYKSVKYSVFVPMLIKAIQELKADNDSLKARIETLENN